VLDREDKAKHRFPYPDETRIVDGDHIFGEETHEGPMVGLDNEVGTSKKVMTASLDGPGYRRRLQLDDRIASLGVEIRERLPAWINLPSCSNA
jgi:hypothetical protein